MTDGHHVDCFGDLVLYDYSVAGWDSRVRTYKTWNYGVYLFEYVLFCYRIDNRKEERWRG